MKRFVVISVAISIVLLLTAALPAAAPPNPFRGNWKGIDGDGSNLSLSFDVQKSSGGRIFEIQGSDNVCSACGGSPARMEGIGVLDGENSISASTVWWTVPTGDPAFYFNEGNFTYDPVNDTVTDPEGIVYTRK